MYSARVNGQPTTFGTSGLLFRSNKLMYDRATNTLWHQFTGEPVIGELAGMGGVAGGASGYHGDIRCDGTLPAIFL